MKKKIMGLLTLIILSSLFLSISVSAQYKFGASVLNRQNIYSCILEDYLKESAEKLNIDITVMDGQNDSNVQMNQVQNFITSGVDAILLAPCSIDGAKGAYKLASDANIPVLTFDCGAPGNYVAHVGTDNYKGGVLAAKYIAEELLENQEGKVAFVGYVEIEPCLYREEGFFDTIKNYPLIEVVDSQNCSGSVEKAISITQNMLLKHDELDAIFYIGDPFAIAGYQVVKSAKRNVKIVGFDASPDVVAEIKKDNGILVATVAQDAEGIASTVVEYAVKYLNGEEVPKETLIEGYIVDFENTE